MDEGEGLGGVTTHPHQKRLLNLFKCIGFAVRYFKKKSPEWALNRALRAESKRLSSRETDVL